MQERERYIGLVIYPGREPEFAEMQTPYLRISILVSPDHPLIFSDDEVVPEPKFTEYVVNREKLLVYPDSSVLPVPYLWYVFVDRDKTSAAAALHIISELYSEAFIRGFLNGALGFPARWQIEDHDRFEGEQ